jgi:ADP-ribose pyrophosphatase YjhB (NUDIX family)
VVINQGQVLLLQREDVHVWALPGGEIEPGESVAQAAVREVREETGLGVELVRLVGLYAHPNFPGDSHSAVFVAAPLRGTLRPQESEVLAVQYFSSDALPEHVLWWHQQPIQDVLVGIGGSAVWLQQPTWPFQDEITPQQFFEWRSRGEIPDHFRQAAWNAWCRLPLPGEQTCEVRGHETMG